MGAPAVGSAASLAPSSPPYPPLPGRSRHAPAAFRQGDLDGLCGLYVLVNALTVLAARHPRFTIDPKQLFAAGLAAVATRMPLVQALLEGIEPELWIEALCAMIAAQGNLFSPPITARLLFEPGDKVGAGRMRRTINEALALGAAVAVSLGGQHDHYTLIVRHTATRYVLHDSGELRWLAKAACGTDRSSRRHQIGLRWVLALERTASSGMIDDTIVG